ncbi:MAG: DUF721 domain-containing protein [Alloprevotella sp.]|nr:DUF721 domain-containing protein [Alloprevotella sp.]
MKRQKPESLNDVLGRFLQTYSLDSPLAEHRLILQWESIVGSDVARKTTSIYINGGVLHVRLSSPALRTSILMQRQDIVRRLNASVGDIVVSDLRLI